MPFNQLYDDCTNGFGERSKYAPVSYVDIYLLWLLARRNGIGLAWLCECVCVFPLSLSLSRLLNKESITFAITFYPFPCLYLFLSISVHRILSLDSESIDRRCMLEYIVECVYTN